MKEEIKKHFAEIGGLNLSMSENDQNVFKKEILEVERFTALIVDDVLQNIWSAYNGLYFNKKVGITTHEKIPILGNSNSIDFSRFFSIKAKGDIIELIKSNEDIFDREYLPFAEALEGDYFAYNLVEGSVYFILHDFHDEEKSHHKVANTAKDFFLKLEILSSEDVDTVKPTLVKSTFSKAFLDKAKKYREGDKNI